MKALFILPHPEYGAASRYRAYQYFPFLEQAGVECTPATLLPTEIHALAAGKGRYATRAAALVRAALRRMRDIATANRYDVIYVLREAFPFGPPLFEYLCTRRDPRVVYDIDDAVYLRPQDATSPIYALRDYGKPGRMMSWADQVIVANSRLFAYARKRSSSVTLIPTAIDMRRYALKPDRSDRTLTLGWIGSPSTAPYLGIIEDVLRSLAGRYEFVLRIVGATPLTIRGVQCESKPWVQQEEIDDLHTFDVGLMPLGTDEFSLGKSGCKALQYMGVGIPVMASREGPGQDIVEDGVEGFLASSDREWEEKLEILIKDASLRHKMGQAGRRKVEEQFSVQQHWTRLLDILRNAAEAGH